MDYFEERAVRHASLDHALCSHFLNNIFQHVHIFFCWPSAGSNYIAKTLKSHFPRKICEPSLLRADQRCRNKGMAVPVYLEGNNFIEDHISCTVKGNRNGKSH